MNKTNHFSHRCGVVAAALALGLLAGCTAAPLSSSSASVSAPASASSSAAESSSAQAAASTSSSASAPVDSSYAAAVGPAYAMEELWTRLAADGKVWMPAQAGEGWSDMGGFAYPVLSFTIRGDGGYQMSMYSAAGSGSRNWVFSQSTRDEAGTYRLTAEQADNEGNTTVYLDGCGDQLALVLHENGTLDVQMERPAAHATFVHNELLYPMNGGYWEAAPLAGDDEALLNQQADASGRVNLSDTEYLLAGSGVLPLQTWQAMSLEKAQALID